MEGIQIELTSDERQMLLDALMHPTYIEKVQDPATERFIREIYKKLKAKLIFDERVQEKNSRNENEYCSRPNY